MTKKKKKRIVAALTTVVLVLGVIAAVALAARDGSSDVVCHSKNGVTLCMTPHKWDALRQAVANANRAIQQFNAQPGVIPPGQ